MCEDAAKCNGSKIHLKRYNYQVAVILPISTEDGRQSDDLDFRNRITSANRTLNGQVVGSATYKYDALGRRIGGLVDTDGATGNAPLTQTWMVYDGEDAFSDFNGSQVETKRYLVGPGSDNLVARSDANGENLGWYLTDRLGSVRHIVGGNGADLYRSDYTLLGNSEATTGTGGDRFGFTSREFEPAIGLQFNRARAYDPTWGRWTSEDPIGFAGGDYNLYRYVGNAATNYTDPSGKIVFVIPLAFYVSSGIAIAGGAIWNYANYEKEQAFQALDNGQGIIDWDDVAKDPRSKKADTMQAVGEGMVKVGVGGMVGTGLAYPARALFGFGMKVAPEVTIVAGGGLTFQAVAGLSGSISESYTKFDNWSPDDIRRAGSIGGEINGFVSGAFALKSPLGKQWCNYGEKLGEKTTKNGSELLQSLLEPKPKVNEILKVDESILPSAVRNGLDNPIITLDGKLPSPFPGGHPKVIEGFGLAASARNIEQVVRHRQGISNKFPNDPLPKDGRSFGEVRVTENGLVKMKNPPTPLNPKGKIHDDFPAQVDFVVTMDGKLVIGNRHAFLGNRNEVLAVGTMEIRGGKVVEITNRSGHYRPSVEEAKRMPDLLRSIGVDLKGTRLRAWKFGTDDKNYIITEDLIIDEVLK